MAPEAAALQAFLGRAMSVRQAEAVVRDLVRGAEAEQAKGRSGRAVGAAPDPDVHALEEGLIAALGAKASIRPASADAGAIVIEHLSAEHLEGMLARLLSASRRASD